MIKYKRILKEIKNIEEFDKKKKNRIIRGAILTEVFGLYREVLKVPFFLMCGIVGTIELGFKLTADILEIVNTILKEITNLCDRLPIIQFVNKEDYVETLEIIKKKNS